MDKEILEAGRKCVNYDTCVDCPLRDAEICQESFAKAIVEHHERYRWHDLRKNPNDLPANFHTVVICLKGFEGKQAGVNLAIHSTFTGLWGTENFSYKDYEVIAWREIEPFEPEERCPNDYHGGEC